MLAPPLGLAPPPYGESWIPHDLPHLIGTHSFAIERNLGLDFIFKVFFGLASVTTLYKEHKKDAIVKRTKTHSNRVTKRNFCALYFKSHHSHAKSHRPEFLN